MVGFRPDPQHWPADLLAAEGKDLMNPGTDWIEQGRRLLETLRSGSPTRPPPRASTRSDCRWCPVCQAAAVVRGERPEVTAALADVLTTAAAALRTFAEAGRRHRPARRRRGRGRATATRRAVQRIDIA